MQDCPATGVLFLGSCVHFLSKSFIECSWIFTILPIYTCKQTVNLLFLYWKHPGLVRSGNDDRPFFYCSNGSPPLPPISTCKEESLMSTERQESKLIRNIGFWPLMGIAYGQIIGAGIMTQTGIAIGMTGIRRCTGIYHLRVLHHLPELPHCHPGCHCARLRR